jgi:hypothetical protein
MANNGGQQDRFDPTSQKLGFDIDDTKKLRGQAFS